MSAPSRTNHDPAGSHPASGGGFGWGQRTDRSAGRGAPPDTGAARGGDTGTARDRRAGVPMQPPIGTGHRHGDDGSARDIGTDDRHERADAGVPIGTDRANAAAAPVSHDIDVPAVDGDGALVMRSRAGEVAVRGVENLRFVNMKDKSLREVLHYARNAEDNLSHILAVYSFRVAFFYWVTVPVLSSIEFMKWIHVRPHRAVIFWLGFFTGAHFLNRVADWLVPDWLDAGTWSPMTWAWIAGGAFVLLLATVITYVRNR
jgi:hypothetical protein